MERSRNKNRTDLLIQEIRDIADCAMIQRQFSYKGALHQITAKAKIKFAGKIKKGIPE